MISFTLKDIAASIYSATLYGAVYSIFFCLVGIIFSQIRIYFLIPAEVFGYNGSIWKVTLSERSQKEGKNKNKFINLFLSAAAFLKTLLFFLGITVMSYYALDGMIRLYFIAFAVFSARLLSLICDKIWKIILRALLLIYKWIIIAFRIVTYPLRFAFCVLRRFLWKFADKIVLIIPDRGSSVLDKRINK